MSARSDAKRRAARSERRGYMQALRDAEAHFRALSDEAEAEAMKEGQSVERQFSALGRAVGLGRAVNWCMWRPMHLSGSKDAE